MASEAPGAIEREDARARRAPPPVAHGGAPRGWLDFSANLNPCEVPAAVRRAVGAAEYARYGDLQVRTAEARLAREAGAARDQVLLTAGATEALRLVASAFLDRGDRALVVGPTYGEFARVSLLAGAEVEEVRARPPGFRPPLRPLLARLAANPPPRAVFLCDPNSPTGAQLTRPELRAVLGALPRETILALDQSFLPFARPTLAPLELLTRGNVIVIRSLTKRLAAPGLRLGYALAPRRLLDALRAVRDPWPLGAHACAAARVARWRVPPHELRAIRLWRGAMADRLRRVGLRPLPSAANFFLVRVGPAAERLVAALARRGIAVRWCASFELPEHVRVAVRPPEEQDALVEALAAVRREVRW